MTLAALMAVPLAWAGAPATARAPGHTTAGIISAVAGGVGGPGPATDVAIGSTFGVAYSAGHLYVAAVAIRDVSAATDEMTTPAGDTVQTIGPVGDGGPATSAYVDAQGTPAVDRAGNLLIGDSSNNRVRVVAATSGTFYGVAMTANDIYTVAGNGQLGLSGLGGPATRAEILHPIQVATDAAGNLYFGGDRVLKVSG